MVDGRASLLDECRSSERSLQTYLGERFHTLLANAAFVEALAGHLPGDPASQERLPDLLATLRRLEENGIIKREAIPTVPVTVEYSLTDKGRAFDSVLLAMKDWSGSWM